MTVTSCTQVSQCQLFCVLQPAMLTHPVTHTHSSWLTRPMFLTCWHTPSLTHIAAGWQDQCFWHCTTAGLSHTHFHNDMQTVACWHTLIFKANQTIILSLDKSTKCKKLILCLPSKIPIHTRFNSYLQKLDSSADCWKFFSFLPLFSQVCWKQATTNLAAGTKMGLAVNSNKNIIVTTVHRRNSPLLSSMEEIHCYCCPDRKLWESCSWYNGFSQIWGMLQVMSMSL